MDLARLSDARKVDLCKKYFLIGACFLPFVWITNVVWFFKEAFCGPVSAYQKEIRKYVIGSLIGSIFWLVLILSWEIVFQYYRNQGLVWSDYLTFVFPKGRV